MSFYYDLSLPKEFAVCRLLEQLVREGSYIQSETAIAIFESGGTKFVIRNSGRGILGEWFVKTETLLTQEQAFARMHADGDEIPYGRPYLTVQPTEERPDHHSPVS